LVVLPKEIVAIGGKPCSVDYFGSTLFAGVAILGTYFRTILGTGLFFG
jgi:hypothetical protein